MCHKPDRGPTASDTDADTDIATHSVAVSDSDSRSGESFPHGQHCTGGTSDGFMAPLTLHDWEPCYQHLACQIFARRSTLFLPRFHGNR